MTAKDNRSETEKNWLLQDREATAHWGESLGKRLQSGDVIGLIGDLGAGKTTLTQAIARGMNIHSPVTSPTFTLIQEYPGTLSLFHLDPYRLERPEDLADLGVEEYFERNGVVVVEWADKVESLLPIDRLTLVLEIAASAEEMEQEDAPRRLTAAAGGVRAKELLSQLA